MGRIIAVFGATGNQGGSVVRSLLRNPSFHVRAISRNPDSYASRALCHAGAEVVRADGWDTEQMSAAFNGAYAAFVNTNSNDAIWRDDNNDTNEFSLGKIIIDAAAGAGVQHLVFSSGPPCAEMTNGKVRMDAMEMKYKTEQYAKGKFSTVVAINSAWYFENFLDKEIAPVFGGFPYVVDEEGYVTFRVPHWGGDNRVPFLGVCDDFGDIVHGIFLDPEKYDGKVIHGASDILSFVELVAAFEEATGKMARFEPITPSWEAFDTHCINELEDVKLMFAFTQTTGGLYFGPEPSEIKTSAELKRATAASLGESTQQQRLITAKEWFSAHFDRVST